MYLPRLCPPYYSTDQRFSSGRVIQKRTPIINPLPRINTAQFNCQFDLHHIPNHNVPHRTHSDPLPVHQRDQNPNLPLPRRRRPPTLRTLNPLPRANRPQRARSLQERHCATQGGQSCNTIHPDATNHHQHRYRVPRPHAARACQARRDESCGSGEG